MRSIPYTPRADEATIVAACHLYEELHGSAQTLLGSYRQYVGQACVGLTAAVLGTGAAARLGSLYESESAGLGLGWISDVRNLHEFNYCPLCGGPGGRTVDHHLPREHFPEFSVFSYNLIPSCSACNTKRGSRNSVGAQWTLHPYFDSQILAVARFRVTISPPWEVPLFGWEVISTGAADVDRRISLHLERSIDTLLFTSWLGGQYRDIILLKAVDCDSSVELKDVLLREIAREEVRSPNSWNCALLRGVVLRPLLLDWLVGQANH